MTHCFEGARERYRIRTAQPSDEASLRRMLEHSAPADIQLRFFLYLRTFPHELLAAMLRADDNRHLAFVAVPEREPDTLAASAMLVAEPDGRAAEFGIIVDRAHAGQRLGTHLMRHLVREAGARGVAVVYGTILARNAEMIDLARRLGFSIAPDPSESDCVRAELPTNRA